MGVESLSGRPGFGEDKYIILLGVNEDVVLDASLLLSGVLNKLLIESSDGLFLFLGLYLEDCDDFHF